MAINVNLVAVLEANQYANFFDVIDLLTEVEKATLANMFEREIDKLYNKLEHSFFITKKRKFKLSDDLLFYLKMYRELADEQKKQQIGFGAPEKEE
jgi:hypothetical protein